MPEGAAGWGGLLGVDCEGGGGGRGSAGSAAAAGGFLESCWGVSWLALADWTYWVALTAPEGWPRKLSRTASCSWVSWELEAFGSAGVQEKGDRHHRSGQNPEAQL